MLKGTIKVRSEYAIKSLGNGLYEVTLNGYDATDMFYDMSDLSITANTDTFVMTVPRRDPAIIKVLDVKEYTIDENTEYINLLRLTYVYIKGSYTSDITTVEPRIVSTVMYDNVCCLLFTPDIDEELKRKYETFVYGGKLYYYMDIYKLVSYIKSGDEYHDITKGYMLLGCTERAGNTYVAEMLKSNFSKIFN